MSVRRLCIALAFLIVSVTMHTQPPEALCAPSVPPDELQYRFGLAPGHSSAVELVELIENPTVFVSDARAAGSDDPAATIVTTETHAVYPIRPGSLAAILRDDDDLADIVPDLVVHETICEHSPSMIKQYQRTEFHVLFFTFGTEYLIDAYYALNGPDEYGSYWGMYESLDGKLAYQYGSWYFRSIELDGREYTYARHYIYSGVTSRVPGLRIVAQRSAGGRVVEMFDALYAEAVRRHGTTPIASLD